MGLFQDKPRREWPGTEVRRVPLVQSTRSFYRAMSIKGGWGRNRSDWSWEGKSWVNQRGGCVPILGNAGYSGRRAGAGLGNVMGAEGHSPECWALLAHDHRP